MRVLPPLVIDESHIAECIEQADARRAGLCVPAATERMSRATSSTCPTPARDGIAAMLGDALERKAARARLAEGQGRCRRAARRPRAGDDLREELDAHARLVRHGDPPARRLQHRDGRGQRCSWAAARPSPIRRACSRAMCDAIMIRTDDHAKVEEMAHHASVPVINGLTDCVASLPDRRRPADHGSSAARRCPGSRSAWLGDGNNVLTSFVEAAALLHFEVTAACPPGLSSPRRT